MNEKNENQNLQEYLPNTFAVMVDIYEKYPKIECHFVFLNEDGKTISQWVAIYDNIDELMKYLIQIKKSCPNDLIFKIQEVDID